MPTSFWDWPLKSIFWPPTLILRQLGSVLYFSSLVGWKQLPRWVLRHSISSLPVAAGAVGMGCIGFPNHPAWEVTAACNLRCIHCHAAGGRPAPGELSTEEAKHFIDELVRVREFRMLVYTGGEPLVRPDLPELLHYSRRAGFTNVIATNAILITDDVARELREAGVVGAAVSLDSVRAEVHDTIRGVPGSFDRAMRGIHALRRAGILVQVNVTAMDYNFADLEDLIALADEVGAGIMLMYQLVPVGRGSDIRDAALTVNQNERLLKSLARMQKRVSTIIEPVAGPQYWPYLMTRRGRTNGFWLRLARPVFHGCSAGRGFVYIKANGDVWPCPFVEVNCGNIKETPFRKIWEESAVFRNLRDRENTLKGQCGACSFRGICGGCRGRAWACTGDYLAADPLCFLHPETGTFPPK